MKLYQYVVAFFALACCMPAFASESTDCRDLEVTQCHQKVERPNMVEKTREWMEIGNVIGDGLVSAAGRVGVAVGEFSNSPIGRVTVAVIVWKYLGKSVVLLFSAFIVLTIGSIASYMLWRAGRITRITEKISDRKNLFGRPIVLKEINRSFPDGDWAISAVVVLGVTILIFGIFIAYV